MPNAKMARTTMHAMLAIMKRGSLSITVLLNLIFYVGEIAQKANTVRHYIRDINQSNVRVGKMRRSKPITYVGVVT